MFLILHRNIYPEGNGLVTDSSLSWSDRLLISGATGYSFDVDYYNGSPKLEVDVSYSKSDAYHSESVRSGPCSRIGEIVEDDDVTDVPHMVTVTNEVTQVEGSYFEFVNEELRMTLSSQNTDTLISTYVWYDS